MKRRLLAVAVAAALAAGGALAASSHGPRPADRDVAALTERPAPGRRLAAVIVDGWSAAILADTPLRWQAGAARGSFALTPATAADLDVLAADVPDLLARVHARLDTAAPVACTSAGCRSAGRDLPAGWLTDPARIPGLGAAYAGWGVETGVWVGVAHIPRSARSIVVRAGDASVSLAVTSAGDEAAGEDADAPPDAANGYWQARWPLAAGLGQLFVLTPAWADADAAHPAAGAQITGADGPAPDAGTLDAFRSGPLFAGGLAAPVAAAATLTASELTYLTSPTTGCGPAVLCVPADVRGQVRVEEATTRTVAVCDADGAHAAAVLTDGTWRYDYPAPTHQFGMWDGRSPDRFAGATRDRVPLWTGTPPLVDGPQRMRHSQVLLVAGRPPTLRVTAGHAAQWGHDSADALTGPFDEHVLDRFFAGRWHPC